MHNLHDCDRTSALNVVRSGTKLMYYLYGRTCFVFSFNNPYLLAANDQQLQVLITKC